MKEFTYSEIEDILRKALECAMYYQKEHLDNKVFTLYLSNGDRVKYIITPSSVPHLLGINIYALKGIIDLNGEDLVSMLKDLQDRSYELYNKFRVGLLKQEDIFSKHVNTKLDNFKHNIKIDVPSNLEETEFVCRYKSQNSWNVTTKNQKCDYVIVRKLNDGKTGLLHLVKNGEFYRVMSSQIIDNKEDLKETLTELITNQEITMLTGLELYSIYNETKYSRSLLPSEKINKLRNLRKIKSEYNCQINILSDYEYINGRLGNTSEERFENRSTIEAIVNAIIEGKLINTREYSDSMLISLINAWNDHICQTESVSYNENQLTYTQAIEELNKFRNLATSLEVENRTLQEEVNELTKNNIELTNENNEKQEMINKVYEIIKPRVN